MPLELVELIRRKKVMLGAIDVATERLRSDQGGGDRHEPGRGSRVRA